MQAENKQQVYTIDVHCSALVVIIKWADVSTWSDCYLSQVEFVEVESYFASKK